MEEFSHNIRPEPVQKMVTKKRSGQPGFEEKFQEASVAVDFIELKIGFHDFFVIKQYIDTGQDYVVPSWLDVDNKKKTVKIAASPTRNDASSQIEEQLIVELYSK